MAAKRDYYEILGLHRECSADDLKRAYRKLAMENHPDRNPDDPGAGDRFKAASEAYSVLSDPDRRRSYDMFGHAGVNAGAATGFEGFGFGDIFDAFFGGGVGTRSRERSTRGSDLRYDLTITFEEAFSGAEKEVDIPRLVTCEVCHGNGAAPGSQPQSCSTCGGSGQLRRAAQSIFGQVVNVVGCPACHGDGVVIPNPCDRCHGAGRAEERRRLRIRIPGGVDTGSQIRLSGEGEAGVRGGQPGDLYIVIRVRAHAQLSRQDDDVYFELHLNMVQAALGDQVQVPTLEGPVQISIPPGTQFGQTFRLAGRGMPRLRGGRRGDQYVVVQVLIPKNLSPEQRALLKKVGGQTGKPEKVSRGFFEKLRDAISLD
jgi:molecular chaperone DnaJ